MRVQVRFETVPAPALRRVLAARFRLVAGGGGAWRWQDAVARFTVDGDADEALTAVDALAPIAEVDRGDGFAPFVRAAEPSEGLDLVELPTASRPGPRPVPEDVRARFVFDDHVIAAPDGRFLAFVRDARRCHFETLQIIDGPRIALPIVHDYPRTAFSADGRRMLVGGPLDVLEIDLGSGALTQLHHDDGANGFDVAYLADDTRAAIGWQALLVFAPAGVRRIPCGGGRLLRAVLGGRILVAGTDAGTFVIGVRGDAMHLVNHDWRSLDDVWEEEGRVLCAPAAGGVCELRGLDVTWTEDQSVLTLS